MARVGTIVGAKYTLLRELGRGGMATVFAAVNNWTGRPVAIKMLLADQAKVRVVVERFWREARATSKLRHPNLIDVLDVGIDTTTHEPFIVQEFLLGENFERLLSQTPGRRLPPERALPLLLPVMDALDACHRIGVIHRDVKPSNIFLAKSADGTTTPKLIDFGIARLLTPDTRLRTITGDVIGTPMYMAPEQVRGVKDVDARADVWAMGVTLFEALAGRLPFQGPNIHVVMAQIMSSSAPSIAEFVPALPQELADAVDNALIHDRARRTATMRELIDALRPFAPPSLVPQPPVAQLSANPPRPATVVLPSESPPEESPQPAEAPPVAVPVAGARESEDPSSWALQRGLSKSRPPNPLVIAAALVPFFLVLGFVIANATPKRERTTATPPRTTLTTPATRPQTAPPAPTSIVIDPAREESPEVPRVVSPLPERARTPGASRRAPRPATPPNARTTDAPPAVTAPTAPPSVPPTPPVAAPPPDPLAPDETPYSQIRRRSQRR